MFKPISEFNLFELSRRINRPLILDGAMGSLLQQKGVKAETNLWMSLTNINRPKKVLSIHKEYIKAGSDIITTNTFRTNPAALKGTKHNLNKLVKASVNLALEAANDLPVLVAGSNPPAEDCYQVKRTISKKELDLNHKEHISKLMEYGSHFILNETQSHLDEIKIISKFCSKNKIPFIISLFFNQRLRILSGESLEDVINFILEYNPLAIGFNCILPSLMNIAMKRLKFNVNWGLYLNCGDGSYTDEDIKCGISPDNYLFEIKKYLTKKPSFIGSCCGSSPLHIKKIKEYLDGRAYS